jgi:hypothetical protein
MTPEESRSRVAPMIDQHAYEVEGLRDNGETYAVEILGYQTEADALMLAQQCADKWRATVNLLLVPFVHTDSASWSEDQVQLVRQLPPTVPQKLT